MDTVLDVRAQLYLRQNVSKLGLAPLTSMYYFGENQRSGIDDFRPEVHDSDGLSIQAGTGEWIWRPLVNPKRLLVTSFAVTNPLGFGVLQRDRNFFDYEDLEARYETRPSAWIEPRGKWGAGRIELVQIPTPDETNDNVVAFLRRPRRSSRTTSNTAWCGSARTRRGRHSHTSRRRAAAMATCASPTTRSR